MISILEIVHPHKGNKKMEVMLFFASKNVLACMAKWDSIAINGAILNGVEQKKYKK